MRNDLKSEALNLLRSFRKDISTFAVEFFMFFDAQWDGLPLEEDELYRTLVTALNSELDGVPYGEARKLFSEKYLAEMDDHLKEVLELNRPEIEGLISYLELELNKS